MKTDTENTNWDLVIEPRSSLLEIKLKELLRYKDLIFMFVKRDVVTLYKQTVLGPLWIVIQPILTTIVFVFVFGNLANLPTEGIPKELFYLSGIIIWGYFAECFNTTSDTFSQNAQIFGKVYFPRLVVPISKVFSALIKFGIQFVLFTVIYIYFFIFGEKDVINPSLWILYLPVLLFNMALLGLSFGLVFSSLTTKYRDLKFLIQFGVQLVMYATPVIYPLSMLPEGSTKRFVLELNPISHLVEAFKYMFIGNGTLSLGGLLYSMMFGIVAFFIGVLIFNKTEKNFMDTV